MSDMAIPKHNNAIEAMQRRQATELRRLEEQMQKQINKVKAENEKELARLSKDYDVLFFRL